MPQPAAPYLASHAQRIEPSNVASDEQRLWGAVILRAIADAAWVDSNPTGGPSEKISFWGTRIRRQHANRLRDEAVFWFTFDSQNFRDVCANAGLEPDNVRRLARRAMEASDDEKARFASGTDVSLHDLRAAG
jgi:hypothetical protein